MSLTSLEIEVIRTAIRCHAGGGLTAYEFWVRVNANSRAQYLINDIEQALKRLSSFGCMIPAGDGYTLNTTNADVVKIARDME